MEVTVYMFKIGVALIVGAGAGYLVEAWLNKRKMRRKWKHLEDVMKNAEIAARLAEDIAEGFRKGEFTEELMKGDFRSIRG